MRLSRKKIYHALLEYCANHSPHEDKSFYLAQYYDDVTDFVSFVTRFVGGDNDSKTYAAIQRAKTTLVKSNWLYKFQTHADKQYIGEPAYIINYRFADRDIENYLEAKEKGEAEKFVAQMV